MKLCLPHSHCVLAVFSGTVREVLCTDVWQGHILRKGEENWISRRANGVESWWEERWLILLVGLGSNLWWSGDLQNFHIELVPLLFTPLAVGNVTKQNGFSSKRSCIFRMDFFFNCLFLPLHWHLLWFVMQEWICKCRNIQYFLYFLEGFLS